MLLVQRIGFMVSAPFFVAFYMWQLGIKRVPVLVIGSIGITAAFVLLFGRFLYVALPRVRSTKGVELLHLLMKLYVVDS